MPNFKALISLLTIVLFSKFALASEPNFKCDIFTGVNSANVSGSLALIGDDPANLTYELTVSDGGGTRKFDGNIFVAGSLEFTSLGMDAQQAIMSAMRSSKRVGLTTGQLVLFSNTKDASESTLNIYLMPSGEIAYLQIGALDALCM